MSGRKPGGMSGEAVPKRRDQNLLQADADMAGDEVRPIAVLRRVSAASVIFQSDRARASNRANVRSGLRGVVTFERLWMAAPDMPPAPPPPASLRV